MEVYSVSRMSSIAFNYERICALILISTAVNWPFSLQNRAKTS